MIRINLLPYREQKRKQQQQQFFVMLGGVAVLGATIWFAVHSYLGNHFEQQNERNAFLEAEIAAVDKQISEIKKLQELTVALLQRKKVVEALQANRAETVYLLDQLVRQLPDGVYLKSIQQKGTLVNITGFAQSNARVSTFMRNLESSPYLKKPGLIEIKAVTDRGTRLSEFSLAVTLARTSDEPEAKKPAAKPAVGTRGPIPSSQVLTRPSGSPPASAPAAAASAQSRPGGK